MAEDEEKIQKRNFEAYKIVVETRRHEIDLLWRRSGFFGLFIAASFFAFVQLKNNSLLQFAMVHFGFLVSVAWYLVNRAGKLWQEEWHSPEGC